MKRAETLRNAELNSFKLLQKTKKSLAEKLNLADLRVGKQILIDENSKETERIIEYLWITNISRSFVGWCGIFLIKFNDNEYIRGIYQWNSENEIKNLFYEKHSEYFDKIQEINLDIFKPTISFSHGISYNFHILSKNINVTINVDNPNSKQWKIWENEIWKIGKELSERIENKELIEIFTIPKIR